MAFLVMSTKFNFPQAQASGADETKVKASSVQKPAWVLRRGLGARSNELQDMIASCLAREISEHSENAHFSYAEVVVFLRGGWLQL